MVRKILFIVLDTLRYDYCLNHFKKSREILDSDFIHFTKCISVSPWTLPSHISMFTGKLPSEHKATALTPYFNFENSKDNIFSLSKQKGWENYFYTANHIFTEGFGFFRNFFERFYKAWQTCQTDETINYFKEGANRYGKIKEALFSWEKMKCIFNIIYSKKFDVYENATFSTNKIFNKILSETKDKKDILIFANVMQAHPKYNPPDLFCKREGFIKNKDFYQRAGWEWDYYVRQRTLSNKDFEYLKKLYEYEVRFLDLKLYEFLDAYRKCEYYDDTLIIIVSDHGEHLGEYGHINHLFSVHNELLHIPLFVKFPGKKGNNNLLVSNLIVYEIIKNFLEDNDTKVETEDFVISEYSFPKYAIDACKQRKPDFKREEFECAQKSYIDNDFKVIVKSNKDIETFLVDDNLNYVKRYDGEVSIQEKIKVDWSKLTDFTGLISNKVINYDKEIINNLKALGYI